MAEPDMELEFDEDDLELELKQQVLHDLEGKPLEDEIELWVQRYFQSIIDILNGFFAHVSPQEAVERFEVIDFAPLIADQLEGEPEAVIKLAVEMVNELKEVELGFMRAYCE